MEWESWEHYCDEEWAYCSNLECGEWVYYGHLEKQQEIYKMRPDGSDRQEWQLPPHLLEADHPDYDCSRIFDETDEANQYLFYNGWILISKYNDHIDHYDYEFFKMRPDGSELGQIYYGSLRDSGDRVRILEVKEDWIYFTINSGRQNVRIRIDGSDEQIVESGKHHQEERSPNE